MSEDSTERTREARHHTPEPDGGPAVWSLRVGGDELVVLSFPIEPTQHHALTPAEQHVIELVLAGRTNERIAATRGASVRTVANQIQSAYRKLGVASRAEAAALFAGGRAS